MALSANMIREIADAGLFPRAPVSPGGGSGILHKETNDGHQVKYGC